MGAALPRARARRKGGLIGKIGGMGVDIRPMLAKAAPLPRAQMAELVDAPASGAGARKGVEVRVLFWAPFFGIQKPSEGRLPRKIPSDSEGASPPPKCPPATAPKCIRTIAQIGVADTRICCGVLLCAWIGSIGYGR